jgi:hypothetical protein
VSNNVNGKKFEISQNIVDKIVLSDCEASNIFINKKINSETDLYFERNAEIFVCIKVQKIISLTALWPLGLLLCFRAQSTAHCMKLSL